jgi:hypothetical protein
MKSLSIATLLMTLSFSIAANAGLKIGDSVVLIRNIETKQSEARESIYINGNKTDHSHYIQKYACRIELSDGQYLNYRQYSKGTIFEIASIESRIQSYGYGTRDNAFIGRKVVNLKEKDSGTNEIISLTCDTLKFYETKTMSNLNTANTEKVLSAYEHLFKLVE